MRIFIIFLPFLLVYCAYSYTNHSKTIYNYPLGYVKCQIRILLQYVRVVVIIGPHIEHKVVKMPIFIKFGTIFGRFLALTVTLIFSSFRRNGSHLTYFRFLVSSLIENGDSAPKHFQAPLNSPRHTLWLLRSRPRPN